MFHEELVFQERLSKERDAAGRQKGLPINEKYIPPKLDVDAMLEVMRGTKLVKAKTEAEIPTNIADQNDWVNGMNERLGFEANFLDLQEAS